MDRSIDKIIRSLEYDIDNLQTWFLKNGMLLNEDKCQFLIVESSKCNRNEEVHININDKNVTEVKEGKLLGITIDNNLSMKDHIRNI